MIKVANKTRAGKNGRQIYCPKCNHRIGVRHFSWTSLHCDSCKRDIPKTEWLTEETPAEILGRQGGKAKSEAKTKAARANAKKPRGKWATAISYEIKYKSGVYGNVKTGTYSGLLVCAGKLATDNGAAYTKIIKEIEAQTGKTVIDLLECGTVSRLI